MDGVVGASADATGRCQLESAGLQDVGLTRAPFANRVEGLVPL